VSSEAAEKPGLMKKVRVRTEVLEWGKENAVIRSNTLRSPFPLKKAHQRHAVGNKRCLIPPL